MRRDLIDPFESRGGKVYYLILTDGSVGGDAERRKKEQHATAERMGVKEIYRGNFKAAQLTVNQTVTNFIEDVIKEVRPDMVLVNYHDDSH